MRFSPDAITSLLTSLFPSGMIDDLAREREVVVRERKLDVRILVWTMVVGFAVGGEARSIAGYRRTYNGATGQNLFASSSYENPAAETNHVADSKCSDAWNASVSTDKITGQYPNTAGVEVGRRENVIARAVAGRRGGH